MCLKDSINCLARVVARRGDRRNKLELLLNLGGKFWLAFFAGLVFAIKNFAALLFNEVRRLFVMYTYGIIFLVHLK